MTAAGNPVRTEQGAVTPVVANMLGSALIDDWHPAALPFGAVLPPLWHWAAFHTTTPMAGLGPDGHSRLGSFLPDLGLPRRMWAGGRLTFRAPLHVGEALTRHSEVTRVEHKQGRSGPMAIVGVTHIISGEAGPAIDEVQEIVYLPIPDRYAPPAPRPAPPEPVLRSTVAMNAVRLFRYSAATFNGHLIHYDLDHARGVEHYPGLVVHGPMQATYLAAAATRHRGRPPSRFAYRGLHPLFAGADMTVLGYDSGAGSMRLATAAPEGHMGTEATADWL